tara:strand:- start:54 stop:554 length:501 start_codon:yes stop_codon:yes gene_type:complete
MFSELGKVIAPHTRHAENTDTHQYLRKHERDQRRNKNGNKSDEIFEAGEDQATVSIQALCVFIESLIQKENNASTSQGHLSANTPQPLSQANPNARAASAYAHAAETMPHKQENEIPDSTSDNSELGQILNKLKALQTRNIEHLHIERADSFLESLFNAIDKATNT